MEPRPQRPTRATGPYISTGTPTPPPAGASSGGAGGYGQPAFDASSAPPAPPPAIGYDPDYSPGQPLTPLKGPRAANVVGPLLAVAALAIIVAAVAFIVSQFRGDDGATNQPTPIAAVSGSPTTEAADEGNAAPDEPETTQPVADEQDEETNQPDDAEPTRTPRVNRPTEESGDLTGGEEEPDAGEDPAARTTARQWLPTSDEIGDGFEQTENGTRTEEEVVASFGEGSDASAQLAEFGWLENAFRNFERADGGEADTTSMTVSVHRFRTEAGAQAAMPYFAEGSGLAEVDGAAELGEESITVGGAIEGGNAYVIYIRQDEFVLRIGGFSVSGDPGELTTAVAETMLES